MLADPIARCLSCGYDVSGINAPVCPECGSDISADDLRRARVVHTALTLILWAAPLWVAASMTSLPSDFGWTAKAIRTILGLMFAAVVLLFAWVSPSSRRIRRLSYAAGLLLAASLALSLALVLRPLPWGYPLITADWLIWAAAIATAALALVMCGDLLIAHRLTRLGHRLRTLTWIGAAAAIAAPLLAYAARYTVNAAIAAEYAKLNPDPSAAPDPLDVMLGRTPIAQPAPDPAWWSIAYNVLQVSDLLIYLTGALMLTAAWTAALVVRTVARPSSPE